MGVCRRESVSPRPRWCCPPELQPGKGEGRPPCPAAATQGRPRCPEGCTLHVWSWKGPLNGVDPGVLGRVRCRYRGAGGEGGRVSRPCRGATGFAARLAFRAFHSEARPLRQQVWLGRQQEGVGGTAGKWTIVQGRQLRWAAAPAAGGEAGIPGVHVDLLPARGKVIQMRGHVRTGGAPVQPLGLTMPRLPGLLETASLPWCEPARGQGPIASLGVPGPGMGGRRALAAPGVRGSVGLHPAEPGARARQQDRTRPPLGPRGRHPHPPSCGRFPSRCGLQAQGRVAPQVVQL